MIVIGKYCLEMIYNKTVDEYLELINQGWGVDGIIRGTGEGKFYPHPVTGGYSENILEAVRIYQVRGGIAQTDQKEG